MNARNDVQVSVLGLGAMGSALAGALVRGGCATTVWNRSPGKADELVAQGARVVADAGDAVRAGEVVIVCLLDHASVREVLGPLAGELAGRSVVNVTTTSPEQSRELAAWAAGAGIAYLDGGIMAVPHMIGEPGASILYSGSGDVFDQYEPLLDLFGDSAYFGTDAGLASLYDLALLAGMYVMFAGFLHGAAMVAPAGVKAGDFAARAAPWLSAMTGALEGFAKVIDGGDYTVAGQQSLHFSDLGDLLAATSEQGISTEVVDMVQRLIRRQIDAGHGEEGFARIIESIRQQPD
ncbi:MULTISPECIES: NAD(P)-binding domain-containing protein [unclassified Streptomyces]|uniref:NAD(P)-dependent oxidoreductase n=1 Tax=Streptomyces TaxID=1883 RepID=UPI00136D0B61|nr:MULTISPECIES: NAD(P)-binding domain-containing protein [unclassified Streptomyces]NDZ97753.1 NAD(P)-dependent oxidoreductase [Streptomyces sp. SID10116]MYY87130.1 NAD(P)-binding domain-containing protein [Streptomyces sp. SID335]MYZ15932.1 NAD(P)-binding domain-containing protein [Streptomyces sp. SID337]NDZ90934.1 NAD(P)-dependent oxidoreductase [Streptomyces sp. SID10115]NEB46608.1 NAD(P)-dependent oxidoreductase [Streptomyces sp. SID339]